MKKITVTIDPDGEFSVDLAGFHGKGCSKVMEDFGGPEKPTLEREKPEFRQQEKQKEKQRAS